MKVKKGDIDEIVDANGDLISLENIPLNGSNLETLANNTTDYNVKVGHQPFRYDMLGRFGFTLLPFFESENKEPEEGKSVRDGDNELLNDLARLMYEKYRDMLEYFYKVPEQQLKNDYRRKKRDKITFDNDEEAGIKTDYKWAKKILDIIKPYLDKPLKELDDALKQEINENTFVEGKMLDKKKGDADFVDKSDNGDIRDVKLKKIAGLINKLDKKEVKKIKNLLEIE